MCCRLAVCTQMMATQAKCSTPPEAQSAIPACRAWQPPQAPPPCGGKATVCSRPHPSAAAADVQPGLQTPGQAVFALDEGPSRKPGANQPQNRAGWSLPLPAVPRSLAVPDGMCARHALYKSLALLMQGATDVILDCMVMVLLGGGITVECFQGERIVPAAQTTVRCASPWSVASARRRAWPPRGRRRRGAWRPRRSMPRRSAATAPATRWPAS